MVLEDLIAAISTLESENKISVDKFISVSDTTIKEPLFIVAGFDEVQKLPEMVPSVDVIDTRLHGLHGLATATMPLSRVCFYFPILIN